MPSLKKLSGAEIATCLKRLEGWRFAEGGLVRQFRFADFSACFGFMASMATVSESMNHHPEWTNAYNRLEVRMTTHDSRGVTLRDVRWCEEADARVAPFLRKPDEK
jgi:4a-hydroxytetrahydrobiopterin dehydratase